MKKLFIVCIKLFCFSYLYAQTDSLAIVTDTSLIKGFYKNYQEYLANNPSVRRDFSTVLYSLSRKDPTIIKGEYKMPDSLDNFGDIWGFCDGRNIFVADGTPFVMNYWKLQCSGPNPYFYYLKKGVSLFPSIAGLLAAALSAVLPPFCRLMIIDKTGRPKDLLRFNVKKLFRDDPVLLKEFKAEISHSPPVLMQYVTRYNNEIKHK